MTVDLLTKSFPRASGELKDHSLVVGPWRLLRLIGEGEWCQVFQAAPSQSPATASADYALKMLRPELRRHPHAVAMLQREALLSKKVSHPHLACVLSSSFDGPTPFLVFPYQAGQTLRKSMTLQGQMTMPCAVWIARQVAEALVALHSAGWLHGDVKPENIFVSPNGHATLGDFGFARRASNCTSNATTLVGSPAYLAPEFLAEGQSITYGSDVYALGITLYEMLTGTRPFPHENPAELGAAHRMLVPPDPRTMVPGLPPALCRLLRQMLAKEPLRRPTGSSLIELLVDIEIDVFDYWSEAAAA